MSWNRRNLVLVLATALTPVACGNGNAPVQAIETNVFEVSPAPTTTTVVYERGGLLDILGSVRATCAPYDLSVSTAAVRDTLILTFTAAVNGSACPQDRAWSKGYRATAAHVPRYIRYLKVLHTTDLSGPAPEVLFQGLLQP